MKRCSIPPLSQPSPMGREVRPCRAAYQIVIARTSELLAHHVQMASSMVDRMAGLLGRAGLAPGEGLLIRRCRAIHTWFMRFTIDVVFIDRASRVVAVQPSVPPWRMSSIVWDARDVIELPAGTVQTVRLRVGDELIVEPAPPKVPLTPTCSIS